LRVVLDTNVLFSALGFGKNSPPAKILEWARAGKIDVVISAFILDELETNLRENLAWEDDALAQLRRKLKLLCGIVDPRPRLHVVRRKDSDNRILECAVESAASVLITGDLKDLRPLGSFQGTEILTPREFLRKFFS